MNKFINAKSKSEMQMKASNNTTIYKELLTGFTKKGIRRGETFGANLRKLREERGLSLYEVAQKIKIHKRYLEALEKREYQRLPHSTYTEKFLKRYLTFLGVCPDPYLLHFKKEISAQETLGQQTAFWSPKTKKAGVKLIKITPCRIRNIFLVLVCAILLLYLGLQIKTAVTPPQIIIYKPDDGLVTAKPYVKIEGRVTKEAALFINDRPASHDRTGNFQETLNLQEGLNIIKISASKKYNQARTVYRRVAFSKEGQTAFNNSFLSP